jgi:hypothetical protein
MLNADLLQLADTAAAPLGYHQAEEAGAVATACHRHYAAWWRLLAASTARAFQHGILVLLSRG